MKTIKEFLMLIVAATVLVSSSAGVFAQTPDVVANKTRQRLAMKNPEQAKNTTLDAKSKLNAKQGEINQQGDSMEPDSS